MPPAAKEFRFLCFLKSVQVLLILLRLSQLQEKTQRLTVRMARMTRPIVCYPIQQWPDLILPDSLVPEIVPEAHSQQWVHCLNREDLFQEYHLPVYHALCLEIEEHFWKE